MNDEQNQIIAEVDLSYPDAVSGVIGEIQWKGKAVNKENIDSETGIGEERRVEEATYSPVFSTLQERRRQVSLSVHLSVN